MIKKVLIEYFSHEGEAYAGGKIVTLEIGNTRVAAQMIEDMTGADVFRIFRVRHDEGTGLRNARLPLQEHFLDFIEAQSLFLN